MHQLRKPRRRQSPPQPALPDRDLSRSIEVALICGRCDHRFEISWAAILDVERRPSELERAKEGWMAVATCPACSCPLSTPFSTLLVSRTLSPHLFFICENRLAKENGDNVTLLIENLLGDAGQAARAWLDAPLQSVEHRLLRYLLEPFEAPEDGQWVAPLQWQVLQFLQIAGRDNAAESEVLNLYPGICWVPAQDILERMLARGESWGDQEGAPRIRLAIQMLDVIRVVNGINIRPSATS